MSRVLRLGQIRTPTLANGGIADGYIGYWPGFQASGDTVLTDRSGKGAHSSTLWSSTTPWGTSGYFSSANSSGQFAKIPIANWPQRFATHSLLVFGYGIVTKEGSDQAFFGMGQNTANTGFTLRVDANGAIQWASYGTGGSEFEGVTTETPWATAVLASFAAAWDAAARTVRIYVDGARAANYATPATVALDPATMDAGLNNPVGIGGSVNGIEVAANWKCIHAVYRAGALPLTIDGLVLRLHRSPTMPLTVAEWDDAA